MPIIAPSMQKDVYKEFHVYAYHPEVSEVYSNFTARSGKLSNVPDSKGIIFVGLQAFMIDYLIEEWNTGFFNLPLETAVSLHKKVLSHILGYEVSVQYLIDLHNLGYLPLEIKALPEGSLVPYQVPCLTVRNTVKNFEWLPNMIETVLSCENWHIQTTATTAAEYFKRFKKAFEETGGPMELLPFMAHDFSMRGLPGRHAAAASGFGFISSGFAGTDTIPAVLYAMKYYGADLDNELVGASVNATEHSVTCSWIQEGEEAFVDYLMNGPAKEGILSVVADTWDFWSFVTDMLPRIKNKILQRNGKLVVRPDSGDPVDVICGTCKEFGKGTTPEEKGLVECLWDIFGGTITNKNYKLLDEHIGAIYGDSITLARQEQIFNRLMAKGFVPAVVLGVGSYSFQFVTRDTHGSAMKATNVLKDGKDVAIFKDPKTDSKKKSLKGFVRVELEENGYTAYDEQTREQELLGHLTTVFLDGRIVKTTTLKDIRAQVAQYY